MQSQSGPGGDVLAANVAAGASSSPPGSASGATGVGPGAGDLGSFDDEITIRVPARSIYVAVLRTAIAGVAARCDFNVDEIEDLRIAVDEACALLLHDAAPGAMLSCHFAARADSLVAAVSTTVITPRLPDPTSFGWLVLNSLAGAVHAELDGDVLTILLSRPRATTASVS
jgi:serine/threonine-protein kinase RsbW